MNIVRRAVDSDAYLAVAGDAGEKTGAPFSIHALARGMDVCHGRPVHHLRLVPLLPRGGHPANLHAVGANYHRRKVQVGDRAELTP